MQSNRDLARSVYETAGAKEKLTMIYAEEGNVEQLVAAAGGKPGEAPNYTYLLQARPYPPNTLSLRIAHTSTLQRATQERTNLLGGCSHEVL